MFIFNFNVVLFCHPAPEFSPVFLTKLGSDCRGTEEKQGFSHFLEKVVVENGFLKALARDHVAGKVCKESKWFERRNSGLFCTCWWHRKGQIYDLQNII